MNRQHEKTLMYKTHISAHPPTNDDVGLYPLSTTTEHHPSMSCQPLEMTKGLRDARSKKKDDSSLPDYLFTSEEEAASTWAVTHLTPGNRLSRRQGFHLFTKNYTIFHWIFGNGYPFDAFSHVHPTFELMRFSGPSIPRSGRHSEGKPSSLATIVAV